MANMGYCRFRNTLQDLRDCYDHMGDKLSYEEEQAFKLLVKECKDIWDDYGDCIDEN